MRQIACTACGLVLLVCCQQAVAVEDYWTPGPSGMEGLVSVYKGAPTWTSDLHYSGGPKAQYECAAFGINIASTGLHDCDTYHRKYGRYWSEEVVDRNTAWINVWKASAGDMDTGGTYYPPASINDHVTIWVDVYDNSHYVSGGDQFHPIIAVGDNGADPPVRLDWNGWLRIYKVGIHVMPQNVDYWEDDSATTVSWNAYTDLNSLFCQTSTTYLGVTNSTASSPGWNYVCKWDTITQPANCNMIYYIAFYPNWTADGLLDMEYWGDGLDLGDASTVVTSLLGIVGCLPYPLYCRAVALVEACLTYGQSDANAGIAMQSLIAYAAQGGGTVEVEHQVGFAQWDPVYCGGANLCALNCEGLISAKVGPSTEGSVSVATKVAIKDNHPAMYHGVRIVDGGSAQRYLKYGSSRPEYTQP
jgi:hypothetical protein